MKQYFKNISFPRCIITCIISFILLNSCTSNNKKIIKENDLTTFDIDSNKQLKKIFTSNIFSNIEYIPLETNSESLIGEISQVHFYKDRIYILDEEHSKSIFCFKNDGTFLFKIDKNGYGPGEYYNLINVSIDYDNDYLILHCATPKILIYDLDGNYIKTTPLSFNAPKFSYIGDNIYAFYCEYSRNQNLIKKGKYPNLIITNENFKIIHLDMFFSEKFAKPNAIPILPFTFTKGPQNYVTMYTQFNDTIYHLKGDSIKYTYRFNLLSSQSKSKLYNLLNNTEVNYFQIQNFLETNNVLNLLSFLEVENQIYFAYQIKDNFYFAFYNKLKKTTYTVGESITNLQQKGLPIINDIDNTPFNLPYFSDGINYYSFLQPYNLLLNKEKIKNSDIIELINKTVEYDNPILVKMSPK